MPVTGIRRRTTRWRTRSKLALALAIIVPVIALVAVAVHGTSPLTVQVKPAAATSVAAAAGVPGAPSGWSTVFSDDFSGAAGSGIDSQWMYDTGAGSSFGTGEIETMTNSTSNVHLDGNGEPGHYGAGQWQFVDVGPGPDDQRERGRAGGR